MSKFPLEKGSLKSLTETPLKALGVPAPPPPLSQSFGCLWGRNGWVWRVGPAFYYTGVNIDSDGPTTGDNYASFYPAGFNGVGGSFDPTIPANTQIVIGGTVGGQTVPPYPDAISGSNDGIVYSDATGFIQTPVSCKVTSDKVTGYDGFGFPFTYPYPTGDGDDRVLLPQFTILYNNKVPPGTQYISVEMSNDTTSSTATGEVYFSPPIGTDVLLTSFDWAVGFTGQPVGHEAYRFIIITFNVPVGGGRIKLVIRNTDFSNTGVTPGKGGVGTNSGGGPSLYITTTVEARGDAAQPFVANAVSVQISNIVPP